MPRTQELSKLQQFLCYTWPMRTTAVSQSAVAFETIRTIGKKESMNVKVQIWQSWKPTATEQHQNQSHYSQESDDGTALAEEDAIHLRWRIVRSPRYLRCQKLYSMHPKKEKATGLFAPSLNRCLHRECPETDSETPEEVSFSGKSDEVDYQHDRMISQKEECSFRHPQSITFQFQVHLTIK